MAELLQANAVRIQFSVFHFGVALNSGVERRAFCDDAINGPVLSRLLNSRGGLKPLAGWGRPVNLDVCIINRITCSGDQLVTTKLVKALICDALRSICSNCAYAVTAAGDPVINDALEELGFRQALPGMLCLALDYVTLPAPHTLLEPQSLEMNDALFAHKPNTM